MEVPLDGTQYALETGKVRPSHPTDLDVWCMVVDTHFPLYVAALLIFLCFRMIIYSPRCCCGAPGRVQCGAFSPC